MPVQFIRPEAVHRPVLYVDPVMQEQQKIARRRAIHRYQLQRRIEAGFPVRQEHLAGVGLGVGLGAGECPDWINCDPPSTPGGTGSTWTSADEDFYGSWFDDLQPKTVYEGLPDNPARGSSGGSGSGQGFGGWLESLIGGVVKAGTQIAVAQGTQLQPGTYQVRLPNGAMTTYVQPVGSTTNLPIGSLAANIGVSGAGIPSWAIFGGLGLLAVMMMNRR